MSQDPLPKPSVPQPSNSSTNPADGTAGVVFSNPPSDQQPRVPLAQNATPPTTPVAATPPVPAAPASSEPQPALPPTPKLPPTQPVAPTAQPQEKKKTEEVTLPPVSVSALSSMSSNKIPSTAAQPAVLPEKTVLGRPIPQAIRGEATPSGLSTPSASGPSTGFQSSSPQSPTPPVLSNSSQGQSTPPANSPQKPNSQAQFATPSKSVLRFLPFILGGLAVLGVLMFVVSKLFGGSGTTSVANNTSSSSQPSTNTTTTSRTEVPATQTTLQYWGLWEPSDVMKEVISEFEAKNPTIKVSYTQQSHRDYRERLLTAIQNGTGPDLFRFHGSWVPMLKSVLDPIPASVVSASNFQEDYYKIATDQLVVSGQYVGLPLMYDGLVLYYNEDILATANVTPPKTWPELRSLAVKLTVNSSSGIQRGGLAIGNASNVEHFSDILATLILQNGGNFADPSSVETRDALLFYTNFVLKDKVWDEKLPSSTVAFARGDVAMMFAPSWRAHEIKALNPALKFKTQVLPQLSSDERISWGTYWAEGINAQSKNKQAAATFLAYLNSDEVLERFYSSASKVRAFGEPYAKVSLAEKLSADPVVSAVLEDAPYARSWYLSSFTHDNGINDQMIGYYKTAIESLIEGEKIDIVQTALSDGVTQVLKQYGISSK